MQQSMEDQSRRMMQENADRFRSIVDDHRMRQLKNDDSALPSKPASSIQEFDCLAIKGLKLAGITLLSYSEVNALGLPNAECLSNQDINDFIQALTTLYVQKGYIAVRILASGPDADKVLTLRAVEGHVEAIQNADRRLNTGTLFPNVIGQPLNIKDIDQGLDQANRLQSNQATVDILPGTAQGGSILMLRNPESPPWHGGLSLNDSGQESTGVWIAGINAAWDSPFAASDFISLSTQSTTDNPNTRYSRSNSLFYSLPYGYWTLSAFASESRYLNTQQLENNSVQLSGESSQSGVRLDRVITRSQHATSTANVQLSHKRSDNYFLDGWLEISSPKLTVMELGFNQMLISDSGIWVLDASLEKGLTWFGADHDRPIADWPTPEFTKAKLGIKLYHNFVIAKQALSLQSSWSWQGSRDRLPAIEQIELASQSAVHGFKRNSLSGDTGWYWRNTLSARLPILGAYLSPRIGIDAGRVLQANIGYQSLAGMTLGLGLNMQDFNIDLEYNHALHMPDRFTNEEAQIISRLSWQF
jgi:hemolysin activation/secretion protein